MAMNIGANYLGEGRCLFCVWAPESEQVEVHLYEDQERVVPMEPQERGYHQVYIDEVSPGSHYVYRLDRGVEYPDPASRFQPEGVHGPSAVVDPGYNWGDENWAGRPLAEYVIYELHVGTFTPEGTFEAIIPHLPGLVDLGITALELMPVTQFPGQRDWGYDGVYPFAVQDSYGGPEGLKRLVDACHRQGLAVILDVVYNHWGPEGAYVSQFGPYFTDRYRTNWGSAVNFDGPGSDEVRHYFIQNALYWIQEFHVDALRLDAVHAIFDALAPPFLRQLARSVRQNTEGLARPVYLIAESDLNKPRLILEPEQGGYGLDAQWNDDFHHALETLLIGDLCPYHEDYGRLGHLAEAFDHGYVYTGQYSRFRGRRHGGRPNVDDGARFVVFLQNHDQIGNRPVGARLNTLIEPAMLRAGVALLLLSPFTPLLFMGEEYGETAPFYYFVSYGDAHLIEAVRQGRRQEFTYFQEAEELPDPAAETTFTASRLQRELLQEAEHRQIFDYYRELLRLRRELPALADLNLANVNVRTWEEERTLLLRRWSGDSEVSLVCSLNQAPVHVTLPIPAGRWQKVLDSALPCWGGPGPATPDSMTSTGEVRLAISPQTCILWKRADDNH